jgi:hypothetical protein
LSRSEAVIRTPGLGTRAKLKEGITRDIYDRKHQQIAERQQEINYLLQDSHEADSQFKIALSGLISLASKAPDLFDRSNNAEKRLLIGFVFSNLTLEGPTLGYSLRKPFDLLVDLAKSQEWRPKLDALRTTHKGEVTSLYGRLAEHVANCLNGIARAAESWSGPRLMG